MVAGQDITARINPRLISLTLTEGREGAADSLELRLSDHDGHLAMPAKGATIFIGAPKHAKGTGGPARVMAVI